MGGSLHGGPQAGFTLVELLVAMTLLALLLGLTTGSLGHTAKASAALEDSVFTSERDFLAEQALRRMLRQALPVTRTAAGATGRVDFTGAPQAMEFVSFLPGSSLAVPLRIALAYEGPTSLGAGDGRLVMRYGPLADDAGPPLSESVRERVLIDGLVALGFAYRGTAAQDWMNAWPDTRKLPQVVRVQFRKGQSRDAAEFMVALPLTAVPGGRR